MYRKTFYRVDVRDELTPGGWREIGKEYDPERATHVGREHPHDRVRYVRIEETEVRL
jgi:hypothetical protein